VSALLSLVGNIVVPLAAGSLFVILALYIRTVTAMRTLVTGELTYRLAFWGFLFFGFYFGSRPIQILLGPHPMPLVVNCVREFCLIGLFAPAVFLAMMSLVFGSERITRRYLIGFTGGCLLLAVIFVVVNAYAIGGSRPLFSVGGWQAYDGSWFGNPDARVRALMKVLFIIRLLDPVLLIFLAGCIVMWKALSYPADKRKLYDNMPKKLALTALADFSFSLSMLAVGLIYLFNKVPNQWWIYYIGGLLSGILEFISLRLPVRSRVRL